MPSQKPKRTAKVEFRVIFRNTSNGAISVWHFDDQSVMKRFAELLASETGFPVEIFELVGTYSPVRVPGQYCAAKSANAGKGRK